MATNFFIDPEDPATADYKHPEPHVHFLCCPFAGNVSAGDSAGNAPATLLRLSTEVDVYDASLPEGYEEPYLTGFTTKWVDESNGYEGMMAALHRTVLSLLDSKRLPVIIGGDHSVSLGALRAAWDHCRAAVVVYDAHLDLRDGWKGNPFSHASVFRRYHEHTHHAGDIMYVGARDYSKEEAEFMDGWGDFISFDDFVLDRRRPIWLEIDIDVLDAPLCPNTGCPVPGGMTFNELVEHIEKIACDYRIIGLSLVEVGDHPFDAKVAAYLLHKAVGLAVYSQRGSA